jgi:hypothetical protein
MKRSIWSGQGEGESRECLDQSILVVASLLLALCMQFDETPSRKMSKRGPAQNSVHTTYTSIH